MLEDASSQTMVNAEKPYPVVRTERLDFFDDLKHVDGISYGLKTLQHPTPDSLVFCPIGLLLKLESYRRLLHRSIL